MTDLLDDNKKPIIKFHAQQKIQEVDERKIKFQYATKERQRKLNFGGRPDPEQTQERQQERSKRSFVLNMNRKQLHKIVYPSAVIVHIFANYDENDLPIRENDPRYMTIKPTYVTISVSNRHPFPLSRFTAGDLNHFITEFFGKYIIREINPNKATHEKHFKGLDDVFFNHSTLLESNEKTGRDDLNKRAFNVYGAKVFDHELNYLNKRLEILGLPIVKKERALLRTQKTINTSAYNIFELGEV